MPNEPRVQRSRADLRTAFVEQVNLLASYCKHFDSGDKMYAKPMATTLRLMLHQTGKSHALLDQLGLRSGRFFTVASPLNPRNILSECNLVFLRGAQSGAEYMPQLQLLPGFKHRIPFPEWWVRPIAKGSDGKTMSRMDMVLSVANTDGGGHIDPQLEAIYVRFRSGKFLGWLFMVEGQEATMVNSPEYACMRAISHELLLTLHAYARWSFMEPYTVT